MSKYSFTVRKRDCEISLTTDDKDAVEQQLAIWILALSRKPISQVVAETKTEIEQPISQTQTVEQEPIQQEPEPVVEEKHTAYVQPEEPTPSIKPFEPQKIESQEFSTKEYVEDFINTMPPTPPVEPSTVTKPLPLNKDIAVTLNTLFSAEAPTSTDFESILEKSVDSIQPDTSSVVKKDENFCKLVKANNISDRLELLLFTADYFCKYDARFVFSLKQINGKLMNNLAVIVDHGILKIALDNNYLEREGEGEYRLTEYGRSEIYSKMGIWS